MKKVTDRQSIIRLKGVSKKFFFPKENNSSLKSLFINMVRGNLGGDEFWALKDITFDIKKGEFFGIIGRNGCGKSTLLKTMAGVYRQNKGTIEIDGDVSPFLELGVGFNPELTGWENIYLNGAILGLTKKEIEAKIPEILEFSELEPFMGQKLKNYSSGMQVRLAFSVAIHAHAEILFIDEVLAVGDLNFQTKCLSVFRRLKAEGRTIVFVSHGMGAVRDFCDRVALMDKGSLLGVGDTEEMIYKYEELNLANENSTISDGNNQWGNQEVSIKGVDLFVNDKPVNQLALNAKVKFVVNLDDKRAVRKPVTAAISIYHDGEVKVFDVNSFREKKSLMIENGKISLEFLNLPLLSGRYTISVGIYPENGGAPYHAISEARSFKVNGESPIMGIVAVSYKWLS